MVHFLSRMENEVIEKPEDPQTDRFHAIAAAQMQSVLSMPASISRSTVIS